MNICPRKCIHMLSDNEGFLYPNIDIDQCINCGLCEKCCPIINFKERAMKVPEAYVIQNKDAAVCHESTSGGAFTAIAEYVIENHGIVFGAEMTDQYKVRHCAVEAKADLKKFRNSKYVQSDVGQTYQEVKKYLKEGRLVCYSGTPCQIEGLLQYLGECEKDSLVLVDLVCRAVPSPGVWKKYVAFLENKYGKISSIRFRDKTLGYQYSTMEIIFENGKVLREGIESDKWLRMFFSGMIIRPSCSSCKFRSINRRSDFTLWDCLNIHRIDKSLDEKLGVTRVLVHTNKGKKILDAIGDKIECHHISVDAAINHVNELSVSPNINEKRASFYEDIGKTSMEKVLNTYFPNTSAIKIKRNVRRIMNRLGIDVIIKHFIRKG